MDDRRLVGGCFYNHCRIYRHKNIRMSHHRGFFIHIFATVVAQRAAQCHRLDHMHVRVTLLQAEYAPALIGEKCRSVLEVAGVQSHKQLRRFHQLIRGDQFRQRLDVWKVGSKVDKTAGERDQLAPRVKVVQLEIFVAGHQPPLPDITVIRRDPAHMDVLRLPIGTFNQFFLLQFRPAGGIGHVSAGDVVGR